MIAEALKGCKILRHDERATIAEVAPERIREIARKLFEGGCYYSCGMGVDERPVNMRFAMYHVFNCEAERRHVILKVTTAPNDLRIPSITPVVVGASWSEREAMDMLGIVFDGHPEPKRLILPEDWPKGVYPLRKDFPYNKKLPPAKPRKEKGKPKPDTLELPLGPYHPSLHEPEYFELYVKEDKVVDAKYRGFHIHRGMEKLAESRMTLNQVPFLAERICGICGCTHSTAYCQAVEDAAEIYVPERARYIRTIMLEIERLHSHLLWFGVACHLLGFDSGFMHLWRAREYIMDIAELITGNRKTYGINLVGGVRRDIPENKKKRVLELLDKAERDSREVLDSVAGMKELRDRMENVGVLPKKEGREIGVVGPVARASGIDTDVRRDHPYAAYGDLDFEVPVYKGEDVLSRFLVRYDETFQSFSMIKQALRDMPGGKLINEDYEIPHFKLGLGVTEAPRGEDIHIVITWGENKVYRWHPRASTYNNLPAVPIMLRDNDVADAPLIIASIDPCFSCTDHVSIIDSENGRILWRGSLDEGVRRVRNGKA
ncbi:NADH-quinone oxidoreductase subunit C [Thermococcus sp.]|uniref:hydrogenase large subunit n=1 Tax=Thermococcus sp. TaxID=35749 RepID=UPI0025F34A21|nr:NADH-quinone oxidoreductase subunit C [Thermococcus sp.]